MALEVLRQLSDTLAEYGNLDFWAARIRLMLTEAVDDVGLALSRYTEFWSTPISLNLVL